MGVSTSDPVSSLCLRGGERVMLLGRVAHGPQGRQRRLHAAYCVVHAEGEARFTHLCLVPVDAAMRREVFVAAIFDGECIDRAAQWARDALGLEAGFSLSQAAA